MLRPSAGQSVYVPDNDENDAESLLEAEGTDHALEAASLQEGVRRRKSFGALAVVAFVVATCATVSSMGQQSTQPTPSGTGATPQQSNGAISLAELSEAQKHVRYNYGLFEAPCPSNMSDRSEGAKVTLQAIKDMIGAEESDAVTFRWVYPRLGIKVNKSSIEDWSAETQFKYHGGYLYTWGKKTKCLALTPKGSHLTLSPTADFAKENVDWHQPAGDSDKPLFAWIPPTETGSDCEHGCFVYKDTEGKKTALRVVRDKEEEKESKE